MPDQQDPRPDELAASVDPLDIDAQLRAETARLNAATERLQAERIADDERRQAEIADRAVYEAQEQAKADAARANLDQHQLDADAAAIQASITEHIAEANAIVAEPSPDLPHTHYTIDPDNPFIAYVTEEATPQVDMPTAPPEIVEQLAAELNVAEASLAADAATVTPDIPHIGRTEAELTIGDRIDRAWDDFDLAYDARNVAMGRWQAAQAAGGDPDKVAEYVREYKAADELVQHLDGKIQALQDVAMAEHERGDDPPEATPELGVEPPQPRPSGAPAVAAAEVEHEHTPAGDPPTAAPEYHPETFAHTANPTPENLASMSAALEYRDFLEANARATGSEASNACAIAMRTFPDSHAAAARGPEHQIQRSARPPKPKTLAKTLKRGGRK